MASAALASAAVAEAALASAAVAEAEAAGRGAARPSEPEPALQEGDALPVFTATRAQAGTDAAGSGTPQTADAVPVYATRVPPWTTLHYAMRWAGANGTAQLHWQAAGAGYALRLEGSLGGAPALVQESSGGFDAAGIAPDRYTDRRLRRPALAANFQRAAGTISYSASTKAFAFHAGTQDRLTWMLQLSAVLAAAPQRSVGGAVTVLSVAGVRGAPMVWVFRCAGLEELPPGFGAGRAVKLVRDREGPWDSRVEVWLDPLQHHFPVGVRFSEGPQAQAFELVLERIDPAR